jgi:hypothetical protein
MSMLQRWARSCRVSKIVLGLRMFVELVFMPLDVILTLNYAQGTPKEPTLEIKAWLGRAALKRGKSDRAPRAPSVAPGKSSGPGGAHSRPEPLSLSLLEYRKY